MRRQCGRPPPDITVFFTEGHIHSHATTRHTHRYSDGVQEQGLQGTPFLLGEAMFPRPLQALSSQFPRNMEGEKLTPGPFSHRFPLQVKGLYET